MLAILSHLDNDHLENKTSLDIHGLEQIISETYYK